MIAIEVFKQTIMITTFVLVMMLIIEYINVNTKGNWSKPLKNNRWFQVIFASLLGMIPGCLGTYTVVSLYTHNVVGFGALVASMIATFGDEAFIMFSIIPETALKMMFILLGIGILVGLLINFLGIGKKLNKRTAFHFEIHEQEEYCTRIRFSEIKNHFRKISFQRAILWVALVLFIFTLSIGQLGHDHNNSMNILNHSEIELETESHEECTHDEETENSHNHAENEWDWVRITFLFVSIIALIIVTIVPDHFLNEHLWAHIIKKHFLKVFLWTLFAMTIIAVLKQYLDIEHWINQNYLYVLMIALLVGLIPESGPHLIFVSMFFYGTIPLSLLLANSVVQDGHGALPLFAESKRSFLYMKLVNLIVGLIVGLSGYFIGW